MARSKFKTFKTTSLFLIVNKLNLSFLVFNLIQHVLFFEPNISYFVCLKIEHLKIMGGCIRTDQQVTPTNADRNRVHSLEKQNIALQQQVQDQNQHIQQLLTQVTNLQNDLINIKIYQPINQIQTSSNTDANIATKNLAIDIESKPVCHKIDIANKNHKYKNNMQNETVMHMYSDKTDALSNDESQNGSYMSTRHSTRSYSADLLNYKRIDPNNSQYYNKKKINENTIENLRIKQLEYMKQIYFLSAQSVECICLCICVII